MKNEIKINMIGASGTGKTTLAKAVADRLGIAHFDSDDYFHYPTDPPYRKQRSPHDRLSLLMKDLNKHSSWVLSGGAAVWDPAPPIEYSLVVFLYLPMAERLERIRQREIRLYGPRLLSGGDMEADHKAFMQWCEGYDSGQAEGTNTLPRHKEFLKSLSCPVLEIETPMTTADQVRSVLGKLEM